MTYVNRVWVLLDTEQEHGYGLLIVKETRISTFKIYSVNYQTSKYIIDGVPRLKIRAESSGSDLIVHLPTLFDFPIGIH